jgi:hypothetical protein
VKFPVLVGLLWCSFAVAAGPGGDLDKIAASLSSRPQLDVTGEQAHFMPRDATVASQFDTFHMKFDRPTKRFRLSYSRFQNQSLRIDVEAWGTLDCLNMLRKDTSPPGLIQPKMQTCVNLGSLHSMLSENSQGYAPQLIMSGEIESQMIAHDVNSPHMRLEVARRPGGIVLTGTYDNIPKHVWHYWLDAAGTSLQHFDVDDDGLRVRANYRHRAGSFTADDFGYAPDAETVALVAFAKDPKASRGAAQELADHGSRAAKLQLKFTDPNVLAIAWGASVESPELAWKNSTELGELGMPGMYTYQGQLLARVPPTAVQLLPKRFQNMSADNRRLEARKLVWKGAQGCDPTAMQEARDGLFRGSDIFDPNALKRTELETIKRQCDQRMTAPELSKAGTLFADPWP